MYVPFWISMYCTRQPDDTSDSGGRGRSQGIDAGDDAFSHVLLAALLGLKNRNLAPTHLFLPTPLPSARNTGACLIFVLIQTLGPSDPPCHLSLGYPAMIKSRTTSFTRLAKPCYCNTERCTSNAIRFRLYRKRPHLISDTRRPIQTSGRILQPQWRYSMLAVVEELPGARGWNMICN